VKPAFDQTTAALTELAQGTLDPTARRELALRALRDPQLAAELKLALRLADGGAELARDWVAVAARPNPAAREWWRPLAGVTASLAIIAAVMSMPRMPVPDQNSAMAVVHVQQSLPDQIGAASFEAPELFGGSFEAD
jgi:hypothetical protein